MKKIIVSGCSNCPFLIVWNDGEGNGMDSICSGSCTHPSLNKELPQPRFPSTVFLRYEVESVDDERLDASKVFDVRPSGTPDWCPLPEA